MLTVTVHQPEFLPWLGFIDKLAHSDVAVLLDSVQFRKDYFQNRNRVRSSTGPAWLTVPVLTTHRSNQSIREVTICNERPWRRKHLQSLAQHYARAPYAREHIDHLGALYASVAESQADLNESIIRWMAAAFGLRSRLIRSSDLGVAGSKTDLLLAICREVGAGVYLSGPSGRDYLDEERFVRAGIKLKYHEFVHPVYRQCYEPFVSRLSALDLLINHGPQSRSVLDNPRTHSPATG